MDLLLGHAGEPTHYTFWKSHWPGCIPSLGEYQEEVGASSESSLDVNSKDVIPGHWQ